MGWETYNVRNHYFLPSEDTWITNKLVPNYFQPIGKTRNDGGAAFGCPTMLSMFYSVALGKKSLVVSLSLLGGT